MMNKRELTNFDIEDLTINIMEKLDEFLEQKGIIIPDEHRKATTAEEADKLGEAAVYGASYDELKSGINDLLEYHLINLEPIIDDLGGEHDEGLGWNPDGIFCGECSNETCVGCPSSNRPLAIKILK
jgi:hypothetical protein